MSGRIAAWIGQLRDAARLMVGMPSYDAYLRQMAERHGGVAPMTRAAFFRDRQEARYGRGGGGRCC